MLFLVTGAGGDLRPLIRGDTAFYDPFAAKVAAFRRGAFSRAQKQQLAVMGSASLTAEIATYNEILNVLAGFAAQSNHPELANAPILFEGYSLGACVSYGFSRVYGERTIGFMAQKSCSALPTPETTAAVSVPAYFIIGEEDLADRVTGARALFDAGRSEGAPWAMAVELGAGHDRIADIDLIFSWLDAIAERRLPATTPPTGPVMLNAVDQTLGWLGDPTNFSIARYSCYNGDELTASWLPSEATARAWQTFASPGL